MQNNEKEVQSTVETLINRIKEVQQSLLSKLEMQEKLEWPATLENFAVLSSQFSSLVQILQNPRTPNLRNSVLLPIRLSPDLDQSLQTITKNRLSIWSHAVVPDYLRTKLDERIEETSRRIISQQGSRLIFNPDALQKTINQMNKSCNSICELLTQESLKTDVDFEGTRLGDTSNPKDTEQLVLAVSSGVGLKPGNVSGQTQGGGKYASSVKSALNVVAAKAGQPYAR